MEQKIFEAYHRSGKVTLTPDDLSDLIADDAICSRITNKACIELGMDELGCDMVPSFRSGMTWDEFKDLFRKELSD